MKKAIKFSLIALFWIGIWYLTVFIYSAIKDMSLIYNPLFPYPHHVLKSLFKLLCSGSYYLSTLSTLFRIFISIIIAVVLGVLCAIACAKISILHSFIQPLLSTIRSVPVTVFVFILYLIIFDFTSMLITILMVFPIVFSNIYEGLKNIDNN